MFSYRHKIYTENSSLYTHTHPCTENFTLCLVQNKNWEMVLDSFFCSGTSEYFKRANTLREQWHQVFQIHYPSITSGNKCKRNIIFKEPFRTKMKTPTRAFWFPEAFFMFLAGIPWRWLHLLWKPTKKYKLI